MISWLETLYLLLSRIEGLAITPSTTDAELCRMEKDLRQAAEIVRLMREERAYARVSRNAETP